MNWFLTFLIVCIVLVIARIVLIALGIAWLIFLLYAAIRHPRELLFWLVTLGFFGLMNAQPLACIVALGVVGVAIVIADALRKSRARVSSGNGRERLLK